MASTAIINGGTTMLGLVELRASFSKRLRTDRYRPAPTKLPNSTTNYDIGGKNTANEIETSDHDKPETNFKEEKFTTDQTNCFIVRTEQTSSYVYDNATFEAEIIKDDNAMCDAKIIQDRENVESNKRNQENVYNVKTVNWLNNSEVDKEMSSYGFDNAMYEAESIKDDSSLCKAEIVEDTEYKDNYQSSEENGSYDNAVNWLTNSEEDEETSIYSYDNATFEAECIKYNNLMCKADFVEDTEYTDNYQSNKEKESGDKAVKLLTNSEEDEGTSSYGYGDATLEAEIEKVWEYVASNQSNQENNSFGQIVHWLKNSEEAEETPSDGYDNATYEADTIDDTKHMASLQYNQIDNDFIEKTVHKPSSSAEVRKTPGFGYHNDTFEPDIIDHMERTKSFQNNHIENGPSIKTVRWVSDDSYDAENTEDSEFTDVNKITDNFDESGEKSLSDTDEDLDVERIDYRNYKKTVKFDDTANGFDNNKDQRISSESSEVESIEEQENTEYTDSDFRQSSVEPGRLYEAKADNDSFTARGRVKLMRVQSSHSYFADSSSSESDEDIKIRNTYHKNRRNSFMLQIDYLEKRLSQKDKTRKANSAIEFVIQEEPETTLGQFKYSELNYYMQLIKHKGKVEHAAFIDFEGQLLIQDEAMGLEENTASSLVQVINCTPRTNLRKTSLFRIKIGSRDCLCFKNNEFSLVGLATSHFVHAIRSKYFVVLVLSDPESQGSCICQVEQFLRHVNKHDH